VAAALATVVSGYTSRRVQVVAWALAVLVAIARVYVGVHLPLDVLGGMAVGWAAGSLIHFMFGTPHPNEAVT
jgi:undecaprenyl-diphosphatase